MRSELRPGGRQSEIRPFRVRRGRGWHLRRGSPTVLAVAEVDEGSGGGGVLRRWGRPLLLVTVLSILGLTFRALGLADISSVETLRDEFAGAGIRDILLFLLVFVLGLLAQIPGLGFVVAAVLVFGPVRGFALAYVGSVLAASVAVSVLRALGGTPLQSIRSARLRRVLGRLETQPIRTVALLRTIMVLSPPVNLALAFSGVRARPHLIGSAFGLIVPNALVALFIETFVAWLS